MTNVVVKILLSSKLPQYRGEQALVFSEFLTIAKTPFQKSRSDLKRLVELKWTMASKQKKQCFQHTMKKLETFMNLNNVA